MPAQDAFAAEDGGFRSLRRRRESRACDACRTRKTKCDTTGSGRCSACISAELVCQFSEPSSSRRHTAMLSRRLEELEKAFKIVTQRLEKAETEPCASPQSDVTQTGHTMPPAPSTPSRQSASKRRAESPDEHDGTSLSNLAGPPVSKKRRSSTTSTRGFEMQSPYDGSSTYHFFGPTSELVFISSLRDYVQQLGYDLPTSGSLLRASRDAEPPIQSNLHERLQSLLPRKPLATELMDMFARHTQAHTPILYWPSILIKFQRLYTRPIFNRDERSVLGDFCVIMMICAVGSQLSELAEVCHESGQQMRNGWDFFERARQYHNLAKPSYDFDDAIVTLLMTIYLQGASLPSPSWVMSGIMTRIVQDLGLHRRPPLNQPFSVEAESRSRLFWCAYMVDRKSALALGRPVVFSDEDCDVGLPGEMDERGLTAPGSLDIYRTSIAVTREVERIIQLNPAPGNDASDLETLQSIDARLVGHWHAYPRELTDDTGPGSFEPSMLKILCVLLHSRLALFRHFTDPRLCASFRKICWRTSVEISEITARTMIRISRRSDWRDAVTRRCNDLVYNHVFRAAIVLLLENSLVKASARVARSKEYILILWQCLQAASLSHQSAAKSLELVHLFAGTLNFEFDCPAQPSKLRKSTQNASDGRQTGQPTVVPTSPRERVFTSAQNQSHGSRSMPASPSDEPTFSVSSPSPVLTRSQHGSPSATTLLGCNTIPPSNAQNRTSPRTAEADTPGMSFDQTATHSTRPDACNFDAGDINWDLFQNLMNYDHHFGSILGGPETSDLPLEW